MSDSGRVVRRPRRAWPPRARTAAAIVAAAGLAVVAAGCGGSPGSQVARLGSTTTQSSPKPSVHENGALAFSSCMRSHGVSRFPDPTGGGAIPKVGLEQLGVASSQFQAAQGACRDLLPNGGSGPSPAQVQQVRALSLEFSECVRTHGVPSFPDPGSDGRIPDPATVGINQGSPKFEAANQACRKFRPPYMPSNAAYNAYARTHG